MTDPTLICPRCGAKVGASRWCPGCGLNLTLEGNLPAVGGEPTDTPLRKRPAKRSRMWLIGSGVVAVAVLGLLIAAWRIKSIDIPLISEPHGSSHPAAGASGSAESSSTTPESREEVIRRKLGQCVDQWNQERAQLMNVTQEAALATTDPEGNCVIAFYPYAGGADGSFGSVAFVRSPQGEWEIYISSELRPIETLHEESERWEAERESDPNALVVAAPSYLRFDVSARVPIGAHALPPLVTHPTTSSCHLTVNFTGGAVGPFTATVEEATGISCEEAQRLTSKILYQPEGFEGFQCGYEGALTNGTFDCSKGFDEFMFSTSDRAEGSLSEPETHSAGGQEEMDLFAESGPPVSARDARGFNVGPGCSDDPANPLPGCNDSPSVPVGDPSGTCANGITVDRQTTTCGLAENVYSSYSEDGPVTAESPKTGEDYVFTCRTAGPGTTEETICLGRAGSSPLYVRWHP